jgi:glycosyltransferase involved in cell wall biosynthesis
VTARASADGLHVLAAIDSLGQGGAERSLVETLIEMRPSSVDIALFRRTDDGFESAAMDAGFTLHHLGGGPVRRVVGLRRLIKQIRPDVVHSSLWNADLAARLAMIASPRPLVCSLVNDTYARDRVTDYRRRRRALLGVIRAVDRLTSRRVDRFHAVTGSVASHYEASIGLPHSKITVAWRGRDTERLRPATAAKRAIARETLGITGSVVLAVGRLEPQKDHLTLVGAMPSVISRVPDARLVIVGRDGTAATSTRTRIEELGLGERVWCAGFRSDVATFFEAADCFVLSSTYEGIAGAVIEAMLAGVPAVATDLPGVREITLDGALVDLIPIGDSAALADAVIEVLRGAGAARQVGAARIHAATAFSTAAASEGLLGIYHAAIDQRRGGRGTGVGVGRTP